MWPCTSIGERICGDPKEVCHQVPWYVCAGNHDYYGGSKGIEAEIQYTRRSARWQYPDFYFSREIVSKDGTKLLVLSIDTWRINGGDTYVKREEVRTLVPYTYTAAEPRCSDSALRAASSSI